MKRRMMITKKKESGGIDEHTLLMLHFDRNVNDDSQYNRKFNIYGNLQYVTGKFGKAIHATVNSFVYTNDSQWFLDLLNSKEFTIEAFVDLSNVFEIGVDDGTTNGFMMAIWYDGRIQFGNHYRFGSNGLEEIDVPIPSGLFHVAVTLKNNIVRFFINGRIVGVSSKYEYTFPTSVLSIGSRMSNASHFDAYIDEVRISNIARWTENFTPPTKPYE